MSEAEHDEHDRDYTPGSLVPPEWFGEMYDRMIRQMFNLPPDTRTPEEKARDREAYDVESKRLQQETLDEHYITLGSADSALAVAILKLHAPYFWGDLSRLAECQGCDMNGYECEPASFPCRTYELVKEHL